MRTNAVRVVSALVVVVFLCNQIAWAVRIPRIFAAAQAAPASSNGPSSAGASRGPVPAEIASGKTVYVTKAAFDPNFPMDPDKSYGDLVQALKAWGRYRLVNSPAEADLVLQLKGVAPVTSVTGVDGDVMSSVSPAFALTVLDAKTNVALWTIDSPVLVAGRKRERERWEAVSERNLVSRLKVLAGGTLTAEESANLTRAPKYHQGRNIAILVGVVLGVGLGSALLLHHEFENNLTDQKAQQDAFCTAHGIPLSQCAGG